MSGTGGRLFLIAVTLNLLFVTIPLLSAQSGGDTPAFPENAGEESLILGETPPGVPVTGQGASVPLILRMLLVLFLAAAAIYGVVYFLKRAARPSPRRDPNVKILSSVHIGSNRFVHVVSIGSRAWLLGAGDNGVNLIAEIDDQDTISAMLLEDSRKNTDAASGRFPDFKALLRHFGAPPGSSPPGADNIRKRRERLKGL
jgi:flagellar protein FliO/FliZ